MNWEIVTWLIIFAVCLIVEIISLGLTTIWACGGALVAMIIAFSAVHYRYRLLYFLL